MISNIFGLDLETVFSYSMLLTFSFIIEGKSKKVAIFEATGTNLLQKLLF
jgi:hypothetical protein